MLNSQSSLPLERSFVRATLVHQEKAYPNRGFALIVTETGVFGDIAWEAWMSDPTKQVLVPIDARLIHGLGTNASPYVYDDRVYVPEIEDKKLLDLVLVGQSNL